MALGQTKARGQGEASTEDEATFLAARAQTDLKARIAALEAYLSAYPAGARQASAQQLLLASLLDATPIPEERVQQLAHAMRQATPAGVERWIEEAQLATELADAQPAGVDLSTAAEWAQDALQSLTEASYRREAMAAQLRYKLPRASAKQLREEYLQYRATFLAAAADVALRRNQLASATTLLAEASRLQPLNGQVNSLGGQLALAQGDAPTALSSFERADALGALRQPWRDRELALFRTTEHGDATALASRVDDVYRHLHPPLFTLPKRPLPQGGHTALLELFTGSGCLPCAGPDLAVESLLASYTRQDLAVVEFDEHIPRPDPLANPDSVRRAAAYGVGSTPSAFLDGEALEVLGASRGDVQNIVVGFADAIEDRAMLPSSLLLHLAIHHEGGLLSVQPTVALAPAVAVKGQDTTGDVSLRTLSRLTLQVALVQDDLRYGGENGIRIHRMVERSLQAGELPNYLAGSPAHPMVFDLPALEGAQGAYLHAFERSNDRFGTFHFLTTDIPFRGGHFAVVAWVQDPGTRRVLQSAFADVP